MDALIRPATEHPVQEINTTTDTRDYLAKSRKDAERKGYADWLIVDIDASDAPVLRDAMPSLWLPIILLAMVGVGLVLHQLTVRIRKPVDV